MENAEALKSKSCMGFSEWEYPFAVSVLVQVVPETDENLTGLMKETLRRLEGNTEDP